MKNFFGLLLLVFSLIGCATNQSLLMSDKNFTQYKTAYVEVLPVDQFNLGSAIIYQLSSLGMQVKNTPAPASPSDTDMKVKYTYTTGWDFSKYLHSFQIIFSDAQTDSVIANIAYRLNGNWASTEGRIDTAFEEFKKQLGTKQKGKL